jgi:uncharacterized Rossmann fold enzyme
MNEHDYIVEMQNPHASAPLQVAVTSNVTLDQINRNVAVNAARGFKWFACRDAYTEGAIIVGGGPSLADHTAMIREMAEDHVVIAVNGASKFLSERGIEVDFQFIIDARPENASLIDPDAHNYILASQCHPALFNLVPEARTEMVHLASPGIEDNFSTVQRNAGGYTLIGGGGSVGNSALCLAHAMGHRDLHVFGFDTSVKGTERHAYSQPMNDDEPLIHQRLGDHAYWMSFTMAVQYQHFFGIEDALKKMGTSIKVYGDGILPERWRMKQKADAMTEAEKYAIVWQSLDYGRMSPAEQIVDVIDGWLPPGADVLDLGCGAGRAAVKLTEKGHHVHLIDFVENSRDEVAMGLPFTKADLSKPLPISAEYGYCCDVMEHIPPGEVSSVLENIASAVSRGCLFRIEFEPDAFGPMLLGTPLHLSVHDHIWWSEELARHFNVVTYEGNGIFITEHT